MLKGMGSKNKRNRQAIANEGQGLLRNFLPADVDLRFSDITSVPTAKLKGGSLPTFLKTLCYSLSQIIFEAF